MLLATRPGGAPVRQTERFRTGFREIVRASGGRLMLDDMQHFGHWITPEAAPRRFDTHFLLARSPVGQTAIPDRSEVVELAWRSPTQLVEQSQTEDRSILFPTLLNLMRLAESTNSATALATARSTPPYTVLPIVETRDDGTRVAVIAAEAGYSLTERPIDN